MCFQLKNLLIFIALVIKQNIVRNKCKKLCCIASLNKYIYNNYYVCDYKICQKLSNLVTCIRGTGPQLVQYLQASFDMRISPYATSSKFYSIDLYFNESYFSHQLVILKQFMIGEVTNLDAWLYYAVACQLCCIYTASFLCHSIKILSRFIASALAPVVLIVCFFINYLHETRWKLSPTNFVKSYIFSQPGTILWSDKGLIVEKHVFCSSSLADFQSSLR